MTNQITYKKPDDTPPPQVTWGIGRVLVTLVGLLFLAVSLFVLYLGLWSQRGAGVSLVGVLILILSGWILWVGFKSPNSKVNRMLIDMISSLFRR